MPGIRHEWTPTEDATLREMHEDGEFVHVIAAELDIHPDQVRRRRKELGLRANRHGRRPNVELRLAFIVGLQRCGNVRHAGQYVGIGPSTAATLARRMVRDGLLKRVRVGRVQHRYEPIRDYEFTTEEQPCSS